MEVHLSMKGVISIFLILFIGCSLPSKDSSEKAISDSIPVIVSPANEKSKFQINQILTAHFSNWLEFQESTYGKVHLDSFKVESRSLWLKKVNESPSKEYLDMLNNYLTYSKDSLKFLDIYSGTVLFEKTSSGKLQGLYTLGSEVLFYDKMEGTKNYVEFEKAYFTFDDASWLSNEEIVIVGDNCYKDSRELSIWHINLQTKMIDRYFLKYFPKQFGNEYLTNIKLKAVNIYLDDQ